MSDCYIHRFPRRRKEKFFEKKKFITIREREREREKTEREGNKTERERKGKLR